MLRTARPPRGTVLLLAAHPDDESLGAGGLLALLARRGGRAVVAFATDGGAGAPRRLRGPRLAALRRAEARAACRTLGASCEFWGLPDGRLACDSRLAARALEALRRLRPRLLLRPAQDDPHPDHRALARAAARAERSLRARRRPELWDYEVAGSVRPDAVVDIGAAMPRKLRALALHRSQERAHRWTCFAERRARARALLAPGARYAEAFRRAGGRVARASR